MVATITNGVFAERVEFHRRQYLAFSTLLGAGDQEVCYGGAKGGGKSHLGCKWMEKASMNLIKKYRLEPSKTPLLIGFLGRKRNSDLVKTTLETFKKVVHPRLYRINEAKQEIIFRNTVKWFYGGFDYRAAIEKFNSA